MTEKTDAQHITEMDQLTYRQLFELRRFAPVGHPYFTYDRPALWQHFQERMKELDPGIVERVAISKELSR